MNEVERFLDRACCGVGGSHELRRHLRRELKEHLTEEIERNVADGMAREEATKQAIKEFGDPLMIRDGLQTVHGRRLMALLIEKSMAWKEKTMKTGWKWSFVAHLALIVLIAVEVFFAVAPLIYIFPSIVGMHHDLGTPMLGLLESILRFSYLLIFQYLWIPCLSVLVVGWGLFEWRCGGEKKTTIRLAGLSVVALVMFVVVCVVCIPMTIDLVMLPRQMEAAQVNLTPEQAERIILPKISAVDKSLASLGDAIEHGDWAKVDQSSDLLSDTCESLCETDLYVMLMAGENQRENLSDIRDLLDEMEKASTSVRNRYITYQYTTNTSEESMKAKTRAYFKQIEMSYEELRGKSDLFGGVGDREAL